jgi:hypothetical protein
MGKSKIERMSKMPTPRDGKSLLYLGKEGYVMRRDLKTKKTTKLGKEQVMREPGFLYFIDKEGYVARTPMKRKGKS